MVNNQLIYIKAGGIVMNLCDQDIIQTILGFLGTIITLIRWGIPIIFIVWSTIDVGKAKKEKEEKNINKAYKKIGTKLALTITVFLIPSALMWTISAFGVTTSELGSREKAETCLNILFPSDPLNYNVKYLQNKK